MNQYIISLFDGKIVGRSKFNFFTFISLLDSNIKYSLILALLNAIGLRISTNSIGFKLKEENTEQAKLFYTWLKTKEDYIKDKNRVENAVDTIFPQLKQIATQVDEI